MRMKGLTLVDKLKRSVMVFQTFDCCGGLIRSWGQPLETG